MNLREAADYEAEFSQSGAKAVITSCLTLIQGFVAYQGLHCTNRLRPRGPGST